MRQRGRGVSDKTAVRAIGELRAVEALVKVGIHGRMSVCGALALFTRLAAMTGGARRGIALASVAFTLVAAGCGESAGEGTAPKDVSSGQRSIVTVPDVQDQSARAAKKALTEEGLKVKVKRRYGAAPKGQVVDQRPAGGEEVDRGGRVALIVSRGAEPAPEPEPEPEPTPTETSTAEDSADCDPSYPDVCIPSPPPALNCPDVDQKDFTVKGDDPHGFDADGDGIGCES